MRTYVDSLVTFFKQHQALLRFLRIAITVLLILFILSTLSLSKLVGIFERANPNGIVLALLLIFVHVGIKSYKWFLFARTVDEKNTFKDALFSYLHGTGLAIVTPAKMGELARALYLKGDKVKLTSLVFLDKFLEFIAVCAFALGGAFLLIQKNSVTFSIIAAIVIALIGIYFLDTIALWIESKLKFAVVKRILDSLRALSFGEITLFFVLSLLVFFVYLVQVFLVLDSFVAVHFSVVLLVFPFVLLTNIVPFTIASFGVRESVAIILLAHFGIASEIAVSTTTALIIFDTVIPGLFGSFGAVNFKK